MVVARRGLCLFLAGFIATTNGSLCAEEWKIGDRVVVTEEVDLRIKLDTVDTVPAGTILTIKQKNGEWLWVKHNKEGWLEDSSVISLNDHFARIVEQGRQAFAKGNYNQARQLYDEVLGIVPQHFGALLSRATTYVAEKDYDKAISDLNQAIDQGLTNGQAFLLRGMILLQREDFKKAIDDFDRTLEYFPNLGRVYGLRAQGRMKLGETKTAVVDLTLGIRLSNDKQFQAEAHFFRGNAWLQLDEETAAAADFAMAGRLQPENGQYWIQAARVLATSGDPTVRDGKQAVHYALKACGTTNNPPELWMAVLAAAYAEAEDFEFAVNTQQKAIDLVDRESKGVGLLLGLDEATRQIAVMRVVEGAPADEAGVLVGDRIINIDGVSTDGVPIGKIVSQLAGKVGAPVRIELLREENPEPQTIEIVRDTFRDEALLHEMRRQLELYKAGKSYKSRETKKAHRAEEEVE